MTLLLHVFTVLPADSNTYVATQSAQTQTQTQTAAKSERASVPPFSEPILYKHGSGHDRLFLAIFDCSWAKQKNGPAGATVVRRLYDQLHAAQAGWHDQVHAEYVLTDCARDNWFTKPDDGKAVFTERLKDMYRRLGEQSTKWQREDPQAGIRIASLGGSWGALQAAAFTHIVDRRGIRQRAAIPDADKDDGFLGKVLVEAGKTAQVVVLLHPVGSTEYDVRLPPSVISGMQIVAGDEDRPAFQSRPLITDGVTEEGRFLGVTMSGSQPDVCGGYTGSGLSARASNSAVDYVNGLSDQPLLKKLPESQDPHD